MESTDGSNSNNSNPAPRLHTGDVIIPNIICRNNGAEDSAFIDPKGNAVVMSDTAYEISKLCKEKGIQFLPVYGIVNDDNDVQSETLRNLEHTKSYMKKEDHEKLKKSIQTDNWTEKAFEAFSAIKIGDIETIRRFLNEGFDFVKTPLNTELGHYAVHVACKYDKVNILKEMHLKCKLDLTVTSFCGKTAYHYASLGSSWKCMEWLMETDPSVADNLENTGKTPLALLVDLFGGLCNFKPKSINWQFFLENKEALCKISVILKHQFPLLDAKQREFVKFFVPDICKDENVVDMVIEEEKRVKCIVCMENYADTLVLPCMHTVVCRGCSLTLKTDPLNSKRCIVCRSNIEEVLYDDQGISF
jgi:hypothetical protein